MAKRKFQLTEDEAQTLFHAYLQCADAAARTRYQAVRMYGRNYPLSEIQDLIGCSRSRLLGWCHLYRQHGIARLQDQRVGGNAAKLTSEQMAHLGERLHQYTPRDVFGSDTWTAAGQFWTVEDLERALAQWFSVHYRSRSSYVRLLHACGFSYQRPAKVFKSQRPSQMAEFEALVEKRLTDVAQTATPTAILTEDEASLYLQATTMSVWAPTAQTPVVSADPSRIKTNFYGTLDLVAGRELVLRTQVMNAATTAAHLEQLLAAFPERPILLFWDRAPWHHGAAIRRVLEANPRLEIIAYPTAAPKLNPQEHVWKATRRATSHNHRQSRLPELAEQFENHLATNQFDSSFLDRYGYNAIRPMFI